jgi:lysophospholipase L1-like esterase
MKIISFLLLGIAAILFGKQENKTFVYSEFNTIDFADEQLVANIAKLKTSSLPIYHIGDSHIQIGEFSKALLSTLKNNNIEIEKGWFLPNIIFPELKYLNCELTCVNREFISNNLNDDKQNLELGITGRTFSFTSRKITLNFNFKKDVSEIKILHQDLPLSIISSKRSIITTKKLSSGTALTSIKFEKNVKKVRLKFFKENNNTVEFYGLQYLNEKTPNCSTYSNFGVSGERISQLLDAKQLLPQIESLEPGLFIFTLGTNDSYAEDFDGGKLRTNLSQFIIKIKEKSPSSSIIIMSVPDTFYQGKRPNNLENVNEIMLSICREYHVGFWDWYSIMGGINSIHEWKENKLVDDDLLHFNSNGYKIFGKLFTEALLRI